MGHHPRTEDTLGELSEDPRLLDVPIAKEHAEQLVKDSLILVKMLCEAAKLQWKYANHRTRAREYAVRD
jgi:hypothetical protein